MPRLPGSGAPKGNQNASKGAKKVWLAAIERALKKRSLKAKREALDDIAEKLLKACDKGDVVALKELGDRLEGKPVAHIDAQVDANLTVEVVRFADTPAE
jgi:hypothetical protein